MYLEFKLSPQACGYQDAPTNQLNSIGLVSNLHAGSSGFNVVSAGVASG
jgi:hypothetical protein